MTILLISVGSVLIISFLCSLSEACLLSTTHSQIAGMLQARRVVGRIWLRFKEKIEHPITVILVLNTLANTAGATIAGSSFTKIFGQNNLIVFSVAFTTAVLFLSEILPKTIGVRYRNFIAPVLAIPIQLLMKFFRPVTWLTEKFSQIFHSSSMDTGEVQFEQEIQSLTALARLSGHISSFEEKIIKESYDLIEMRAAEIMIPADDLSVLSTNMTLQEALSTTQLAGHSRYPLIEGEDRNNVLGYINFKELTIACSTPNESTLKDICRPILFVQANSRPSNLLKYFVETHEHIAMVKSSNDTILGMITFEDILEEIVGEVKDAYDRLPRKGLQINPSQWVVGGGMRMDELKKELNISAPAIDGSRQQLAAWLLEQLGRTPRYNDRVALGGYEFQVKRMRRGKASEIKVTRI